MTHVILMLFLYGLIMNGGEKNLNCDAPGYIGSGCGIPLEGGKYSSLGYSIKNQKKKITKKAFFLN